MNDDQEIIIIPASSLAKKTEKPDVSEALITALRDIGLDELTIADELKDVIKNAEVMNSKWDTITDYATKLQAIKTLHKMLTKQPENQINIATIFSWNNWF